VLLKIISTVPLDSCCSGTSACGGGAAVQPSAGERDAGRGFDGDPRVPGGWSAGAWSALVQGGTAAERVAEGRDEEAGRSGEADTVRHQGARLRALHVHRAESSRRELHLSQPHRQRLSYILTSRLSL